MVLVVKNLPANAEDIRDAGLIPGLGRSPGEGNGNPFQVQLSHPYMTAGKTIALTRQTFADKVMSLLF